MNKEAIIRAMYDIYYGCELRSNVKYDEKANIILDYLINGPEDIWKDVNKYSIPKQEHILVRCKNKNKEDGIWLYDLVFIEYDGEIIGRSNWEDITHWKYIN